MKIKEIIHYNRVIKYECRQNMQCYKYTVRMTIE